MAPSRPTAASSPLNVAASVLEPHLATVLREDEDRVEALPPAVRIRELQGREQILAQQPLLARLAERWGKKGAMDHLDFYLHVPYFGSKVPCLLLFYGDVPAGGSSPGFLTEPPHTQEAPFAAVLLHQYRLLGKDTGLFIPADATGDWTVLSWKGGRHAVARQAAGFLLDRGAPVVLLSMGAGAGQPDVLDPGMGARKALGRRLTATVLRTQRRTLSLGPTLEATLASMGGHTRRNLRLARRRAEVQLDARFHAQAGISEEDFLQLNRLGFYPVPERVARWRFHSAHATPGAFFSGVQAADGRWLAVTGGRRFETSEGLCVAIDWQLNHTAFAPFSPGSVMRAFLIEHEIASGTTHLRFEGGTPHTMRSAFHEETVVDLLFSRLSPRVLGQLARWLPKGNLLGDTLKHPGLSWMEKF